VACGPEKDGELEGPDKIFEATARRRTTSSSVTARANHDTDVATVIVGSGLPECRSTTRPPKPPIAKGVYEQLAVPPRSTGGSMALS